MNYVTHQGVGESFIFHVCFSVTKGYMGVVGLENPPKYVM